MNRRERVKKAFHFDKPDRVPMSAFSFDSDFFPVEPHQPISWQPIDYPPHVNGGSFQIENKSNEWIKKTGSGGFGPESFGLYLGTTVEFALVHLSNS